MATQEASRDAREQPGREEVADACARVSGTRPHAYWQEVEDGGSCGGLGCCWAAQCWASWLKVGARYFLSLSFPFLFQFFYYFYSVLN